MRISVPMILGSVSAAQVALAETVDDPENGRKIARQCKTCHWVNGVAKQPIVPHIGGEPEP